MGFFKRMNEKESFNSKKAVYAGFYTYTMISAVNYFYYLATESGLFSPSVIFCSGLLAFFAFEFILNLKDKFDRKKSH